MPSPTDGLQIRLATIEDSPAVQAIYAPLAGTTVRVGWKLGAWHDVAWYQRSLGTDSAPPAPPVALNELPAETIRSALLLPAGRSEAS